MPVIVSRISHDLFFTDWEQHEARITSDNIAPDFEDSLYATAVWKQPAKASVS
ncbi:MAG: hypothetical protein RM338_12620 [Nostoc sp. DedQUE12a]|nr:hypothetical protein [Nostoc sp. DedQUE12a]